MGSRRAAARDCKSRLTAIASGAFVFVIIKVPEDFFQERLSHVSRERFQFVRGLPLGFQQQRLWEHRMQGTIAAPVHGQFGASGQRLGPGLSWHVWSVSDFGTQSGDLRPLD